MDNNFENDLDTNKENQELPAVHDKNVLSKESIINNNNDCEKEEINDSSENKNDNLYHFKSLYGKDYEPYAQAFINITTNLNVKFKPINLKKVDTNIVLTDFILNCIANPLFFNADQPFVDAYFVFAKNNFLPILKQTNLLFLFFNSLQNYALGLTPGFNDINEKKLLQTPFSLYKAHNMNLVDDVKFIFRKELTKIIKMKYKPEISFNDIKKHYFFMAKELIEFNTRTLNLLLILNSQIFCSFMQWPFLGFFGVNSNKELSTLTTEDWTAPFNDPFIQNLFKNLTVKKNNKKNENKKKAPESQ